MGAPAAEVLVAARVLNDVCRGRHAYQVDILAVAKCAQVCAHVEH